MKLLIYTFNCTCGIEIMWDGGFTGEGGKLLIAPVVLKFVWEQLTEGQTITFNCTCGIEITINNHRRNTFKKLLIAPVVLKFGVVD